MDDDGGDWFADQGDEDTKPEEAEASATVNEGTPEASNAAAGEANTPGATAEEAAAAVEPAEDEYLDPDKLILFKHWIRPKFLQYKYLDDYRKNYYDDVIDYLDKRQRGTYRDIPQAQTWAERALRTYNSRRNQVERFRREVEDTKLVTKTKLSGMFHINHSKNYINRRYSSILS